MSQKRTLATHPITSGQGCTHIKIELYYSKGGMNHFTSRSEARGLYVSVQPVTISDRIISFSAFSGVKQHVKPMKAFSQKALDTFVPEPELIQKLINHVLNDQGLAI